jgi:hypothetical protein
MLAGGCDCGGPGDGAPEPAPVAAQPAPGAQPAPVAVSPVQVPAPDGARFPHLAATADGGAILSWLETRDGSAGFALRFAQLRPDHSWSEPRDAAAGAGWAPSWADPPRVVPAGPQLVATWPVERTGGYLTWVSRSGDGGATWTPAQRLHEDDGAAEHGFASAVAGPDGSTVLLWLDGRGFPTGAEETRVLARTMDASGALGREETLDSRACDCCPTAALALPGGAAIAAYRDRDDKEVRDVALVRREPDGRWSAPAVAVPDAWEFAGCPVNGPALALDAARDGDEDGDGAGFWLAWFSEGGGAAAVRAARSTDGGRSFGPAVEIVRGATVGRVALAADGRGGAWVAWVAPVDAAPAGETPPAPRAALRLRHAAADGALSDPIEVAEVSASRKMGFPKAISTRDGVILAWAKPAEAERPDQILAARVSAPSALR